MRYYYDAKIVFNDNSVISDQGMVTVEESHVFTHVMLLMENTYVNISEITLSVTAEP